LGACTLNSASGSFSPDAFAARLREIRKATGRTGAEIAQHGCITKQTFSGYLHTGRLPSASVLANWVYRLGINANWLLTGEGAMLLDQDREGQDPVVQRVAELVEALREAGAVESEILQSVQSLLEGELAKLEQTAPDLNAAP
jgi:transcriptional regulator with XRE-family HTH domain